MNDNPITTEKRTRGPKPGYKQTLEHRKNLSLAKKGVPLTPAQRAATPMQAGKPGLFTGHKHTPETIAKMSMNHKRPRTYICDICKSKLTK